MPNQKSKHHDGVTSDLNQPAHSQKRHRKKSCTLPTPSFQTETYEAFPITFPTGLYCLMIPGVIKISNKLHITIHYTLYSLFHVLIRVFTTSSMGKKAQLKKQNLIFFLYTLITLQKKKIHTTHTFLSFYSRSIMRINKNIH